MIQSPTRSTHKIFFFLPADEIDAKYDRELNETVELTQTSEIAFGTFRRVARSLFEWTAGSIRKCPQGKPPFCRGGGLHTLRHGRSVTYIT